MMFLLALHKLYDIWRCTVDNVHLKSLSFAVSIFLMCADLICKDFTIGQQGGLWVKNAATNISNTHSLSLSNPQKGNFSDFFKFIYLFHGFDYNFS